jgi:hypothetical protein
MREQNDRIPFASKRSPAVGVACERRGAWSSGQPQYSRMQKLMLTRLERSIRESIAHDARMSDAESGEPVASPRQWFPSTVMPKRSHTLDSAHCAGRRQHDLSASSSILCACMPRARAPRGPLSVLAGAEALYAVSILSNSSGSVSGGTSLMSPSRWKYFSMDFSTCAWRAVTRGTG